MPPDIDAVIRPTLADRQGWAVFIGTPRGHNRFYDVWLEAKANPDRWFSSMLKASETNILPHSELADAKLSMTPEAYEAEFECSFEAAILGAYFGKEMVEAERTNRIKPDLPLINGEPVHTAWDLGSGDHMAIWCFQVGAGEVRVIDFLQSHGHDMSKYCADLDQLGYHGKDYVPHDARVKSLETGRTRVETLLALGRKPQLVPPHKVEDGIEATRLTFPRLWFDATKCRDGLEALRQYRSDYDPKNKTFRLTPRHDWTSHAADAMRYLCMAWREKFEPEVIKPPPLFKPLSEMTFDELLEAEEDEENARAWRSARI